VSHLPDLSERRRSSGIHSLLELEAASPKAWSRQSSSHLPSDLISQRRRSSGVQSLTEFDTLRLGSTDRLSLVLPADESSRDNEDEAEVRRLAARDRHLDLLYARPEQLAHDDDAESDDAVPTPVMHDAFARPAMSLNHHAAAAAAADRRRSSGLQSLLQFDVSSPVPLAEPPSHSNGSPPPPLSKVAWGGARPQATTTDSQQPATSASSPDERRGVTANGGDVGGILACPSPTRPFGTPGHVLRRQESDSDLMQEGVNVASQQALMNYGSPPLLRRLLLNSGGGNRVSAPNANDVELHEAFGPTVRGRSVSGALTRGAREQSFHSLPAGDEYQLPDDVDPGDEDLVFC